MVIQMNICRLTENVETLESRCLELQISQMKAEKGNEIQEVEKEEKVEYNTEDEVLKNESLEQIKRNKEKKVSDIFFDITDNFNVYFQAAEERELALELVISRMTDRLILLEQENREGRCLMMQMEEQMSALIKENRQLKESFMEKEMEAMSVEDEFNEK